MARWIRQAIDNHDEQLARLKRSSLGQKQWLVSWYSPVPRLWIARLSCPDWPDTVEGSGKTRLQAIEEAEETLLQLVLCAS